MERVFKNVPDGLPEAYPQQPPQTGYEVSAWREANRRIFNTLNGLNPLGTATAIIRIDRWGLEGFSPDLGVFGHNQLGFLVISTYPSINNLNPHIQGLERLDIGAAYTPRPRDLSLVFEPDSAGTDFERWGFLYKVAERLS